LVAGLLLLVVVVVVIYTLDIMKVQVEMVVEERVAMFPVLILDHM